MSEVDSRWGLIEAAFQMKREVDASLESDIRALYLLVGMRELTLPTQFLF